jgi:hypothetical protein
MRTSEFFVGHGGDEAQEGWAGEGVGKAWVRRG